MEPPYILNSNIIPEDGKRLDAFDKHSKYVVKVLTSTDFSKRLFEYAEYFFEAAHKITEFVLYEAYQDTGKRDTYFFSIAFLYRHCIELGLKAIGFQYIQNKEERKRFVKDTRHNLSEILSVIEEKVSSTRSEEEMEWLRKYLVDLSRKDRESDSFRYPFHIVWKSDDWGEQGAFVIEEIFEGETYIDLIKFANKFEAAYEIIDKWYKKEDDSAVEWKKYNPVFIEADRYYYAQSVVGYKYRRTDFYPYTKAYLETANYLKRYMKDETDLGNSEYNERLFLPMCYLYRNCVELSLKSIWFEDVGEDFQTKCKLMLDNKHSIVGMWRKIKPYVLECSLEMNDDDLEYIDVIEDYCMQVHRIDDDANKFRYPMSNSMQKYFSHNKRFDFVETGDFFEALNNILDAIDSALNEMNTVRGEMEAAYGEYY